MSYSVRIDQLDGTNTLHNAIECVNFINPSSHGDPFFLLSKAGEPMEASASDEEGGTCLFINTAAVVAVRIS